MELLSTIKSKKPRYLAEYKNLVETFTPQQGGKSGTVSAENIVQFGKTFNSEFQMYMYATILGIHNDYKIIIENKKDTCDFWEMKNWKPSEVVDYIIMMVIQKEGIDLLRLAKETEEEVSSVAVEIVKSLEGYANGGLDLIQSKLKDEVGYAQKFLWYMNLLKEVIPDEKSEDKA